MANNNLLSNTSDVLHFERDIRFTPLGELFRTTLAKRLNVEIVDCGFEIHRENLCLYLKLRGKTGGVFGAIASYQENNVLDISDPFCSLVWDALTECRATLSMPSLTYYNEKEKTPYRLSVSLYDFVKRSRFAYFHDYALLLENALKETYTDLSFSFRVKDDNQYYYLIFQTEEDLKRAETLYGIEAMNQTVWELCKKDDPYRVFFEPLPMPEVLTKQQVIERGLGMGIIRNNPHFDFL